MRRVTKCFLGVLVTVALASCGSKAETTDSVVPTTPGGATATTVPETPRQGGSLTYLVNAELPSLDPVKMPNFSAQMNDAIRTSALYDVLVWQNPATSAVEMGTAESLTSTDPKIWTLKLRPNIKFSDGTPYDAEAVKFNWLRFQDPANASPQLASAKLMTALDVVDALTLKITLSAPNGQFPRIVAGSFPGIASPTALKAEGANFTNKPVGAGPFMLKEWVRDSQMTLVRNPTYWNAPRPYLDELKLKVITDNDQRLRSLNAGEGQIMYTASSVQIGQATAGTAGANLTARTFVASFGRVLALNNSKAPFNDVRARKAVQLAIDRDDFVKIANQGYGAAAHNYFVKESPFYDASLNLPAYNAVEAQRLFDEVSRDLGGPVTFTIMHVPGFNLPQVEYFQAKLSAFKNVNVSIVGLPPTELTARLRSADYTASLDAIPLLNPEPLLFEKYSTGAVRNFTQYKNTAMDTLLQNGLASLDDKVRAQVYSDVQKKLLAEVPDVLYERYTIGTIYNTKVMGFQPAQDAVPLFDRMWLKP